MRKFNTEIQQATKTVCSFIKNLHPKSPVIFVGSHAEYTRPFVKAAAFIAKQYFCEAKWIPGKLSNWDVTIAQSGVENYYVQHALRRITTYKKSYKVQKELYTMIDYPSIIILLDTKDNRLILREARNSGVVSILITPNIPKNSLATYTIPCDVENHSHLNFVLQAIASACRFRESG